VIRVLALALAATATAAAPAPAAVRETPVPILIYHHVATPPKGDSAALWVPRRRFARHVEALDRAGYTAITLGRAWRHWSSGAPLPKRPVILSFDDGFGDQFRNAAPVLRARGWPGVLYLQVGRIGADGGLSEPQVRRLLRDGWELGAHSMSHADLTTVDAAQLEEEVAGSRTLLQQTFGVPVDFFCYPYGRHDAAARAAVQAAGYLGATDTRRGAASPQDGAYSLDRIVVNGTFSAARLLRTVRATSARR
jgi:peptidoglycan/xylan/chitin deacetylase (PgdA/CDA1 family)